MFYVASPSWSLLGVHSFYRCVQQLSRAVMQECAGPRQHSGESPVFIHQMGLEMQFYSECPMSFTEFDASNKCDALLDGIRKDSSILRTMQCINTGLPHCAAEDLQNPLNPASYPQKGVGGIHTNMAQFTVQLKRMRPDRHSATPLSARSSYGNEWVLVLPNATKNSPRVASEEQQGVVSENFLCLNLNFSYKSRTNCERNTKLGRQGKRGRHYRWRVTPTSGIVHLPRQRIQFFLMVDH